MVQGFFMTISEMDLCICVGRKLNLPSRKITNSKVVGLMKFRSTAQTTFTLRSMLISLQRSSYVCSEKASGKDQHFNPHPRWVRQATRLSAVTLSKVSCFPSSAGPQEQRELEQLLGRAMQSSITLVEQIERTGHALTAGGLAKLLSVSRITIFKPQRQDASHRFASENR